MQFWVIWRSKFVTMRAKNAKKNAITIAFVQCRDNIH